MMRTSALAVDMDMDMDMEVEDMVATVTAPWMSTRTKPRAPLSMVASGLTKQVPPGALQRRCLVHRIIFPTQ